MNVFGAASILIALASYAPYIIDILKKRTKPERASWFLWSLTGAIALFLQATQDASLSDMAYLIAQTLAPIIIFIFSIKYGLGGASRRDKIGIGFVAVALILWIIIQNPILSLLILLAVDMTGLVLTSIKTWEMPDTESLVYWLCGPISSGLGIIAIENFNFLNAAFPIYIFIATSLMSILIIFRRRALSRT